MIAPQYYGGNIAGTISQALLQRDALNHQRDMDAVKTGVGLKPIDPNAAPEHSPLSKLVGGIYTRMTGHANGNDVEDATANMANHPLSVGGTPNFATNETASATPPQVFTEQAPNGGRLPGAFDPMMGGFTPSQGSMMRLPSGQTVDMRYTPYGQRMQQGMLQREFTAAMLGQRLDAQREIAQGHDQTRSTIADGRNTTMTNIAGQRIATMRDLHDTPTGTAIYNANHRPAPSSVGASRPVANAPGSVGALTHAVAADKAAVSDLNGTMNAARKNPPSGRSLLRQNPQADTTAILNGFRADTTATRQQLDAARGRLQQHTAQLGAVAGGQHTPPSGTATPDGPRYIVQPDMDKAQAYESLRDQGYSHEDALNLLEGGAQ